MCCWHYCCEIYEENSFRNVFSCLKMTIKTCGLHMAKQEFCFLSNLMSSLLISLVFLLSCDIIIIDIVLKDCSFIHLDNFTILFLTHKHNLQFHQMLQSYAKMFFLRHHFSSLKIYFTHYQPKKRRSTN